MAAPLAVALHATRRAGGMVGRSVLVTGCGPIGILAIIAARRAAADRIVGADLAPFTLGKAREAGADLTLNMADDPEGLAPFAAGKGSFDALCECAGARPAPVAAIPAMRPRGVILQPGLGGDMTLPMVAITAKEQDLRGTFRFHPESATGVSLMRKRLIDVKPLVIRTLPHDEARRAFDLAGDRSQSIKVQIAFG